MIMVIGICISIKRSVHTEKVHKSKQHNMNSTYIATSMVNEFTTGADSNASGGKKLIREDVVGGANFIANEQRRSKNLQRLS